MAEIYVKGEQPPAPPVENSQPAGLQHWAQTTFSGLDSSLLERVNRAQPAADNAALPARPIGSTGDSGHQATSPAVRYILGDFSLDSGRQPDTKQAAQARSNTKGDGADKAHKRVVDQGVIDQDHFADVAKKVLKKVSYDWVSDRYDLVNKERLAFRLLDPTFKGEEAQALVAMYQNFDKLHNIGGREFPANLYAAAGIEDVDLDKFQSIEKSHSQPELTSAIRASCAGVAREVQSAGTTTDLYSDKDPLKSITEDGVRQGTVSDSYFEAVLASLARSDPAFIRDCIKDNHDGTYTVTFPGAKNGPVYVKAPTEAELALYNHCGKSGIWASVLEKAYGKYREGHPWVDGIAPPQEAAAGEKSAGPAILLLTGKPAKKVDVGSTSREGLAEQLAEALNSNRPRAVVAGINADSTWKWITRRSTALTEDKFDKGHGFSIIGFNAGGAGGGTVKIRNPKGGADGTAEGTIDISLDQFKRNFSEISLI